MWCNLKWSMAPTLKGKNLTLRHLNPQEDSKPFFEIMLDEEMHVWTGNTVPNTKLK
jgi:hypothetical protein